MNDVKESPNHLQYHQIKQRAFSAFLGSTIVSLTVTPLDVVKVRMQAQQPSTVQFCGHLQPHNDIHYRPGFSRNLRIRGVFDGVYKIWRHEGIAALYRGFVPTMAMAVPANVLYFVCYESLKDSLGDKSLLVPTFAGAVARVFAVAAVSPLELLKTRMQHRHHQNHLRNTIEMVRAAGPSVLFRGFFPTLWRDVPFSGIYWTAYEYLKRTWRIDSNYSGGFLRHFYGTFAAGAMAGSIAAILTIPFDVVKTRMQVDLGSGMTNPSLWAHLKSIYRTEGISGLTRGLIPRVGKVAPSCAIMISSYELSKRIFSTE